MKIGLIVEPLQAAALGLTSGEHQAGIERTNED